MRISINRSVKAVLEWLHVSLPVAIFVPALYTTQKFRIEEMLFALFFASFLLFVPVLILRTAAHMCKKNFSYMVVFVLTLVVMYKLAPIVGAEYLYLNVRRFYLVMMLILTAVTGILFFCVRIQNVRRLRSVQMRDATWRDELLLPEKPRLVFASWFVAIYILAQMTACRKVCNIALFSGIVYMVIAVIYIYLEKQEEYLKLNEKTCGVKNIPVRRMGSIGRQFLLINLLLIMLAMIPALISMNGRSYIDMRNWTNPYKEVKVIYPVDTTEYKDMVLEERETLLTRLMDLMVRAFVPVLATATIILLGYVIMQGLDSFQGEPEPETDRIEALNEEEKLSGRKSERLRRREDHKIRKAYRKFIRKHMEDIPNVFETPHEIEVAAGVAHMAQAQQLHEAYERVRYAPACDV